MTTTPTTIPFFDMQAMHADLGNDLKGAFDRVLSGGHLIMGSEVTAFESEFASYCGTQHCVSVGNGLDALALALRARGIGPGDEVLVPSHTFIATWIAVSMVGATLVPVEIDPRTYAMDPAQVARKLTPRTRAALPVHLYGLPAPVDEIRAALGNDDIFILEDAAQAHGARYKGRRTGALGHAAAFSFYPTKNLGCLGDGGAVTTDDDALAQRLRLLRNYGSSRKYVHETLGVNSRLDEVQAAFLRTKLPRLDAWNERRQAIAQRYASQLEGVGDLQLPVLPPETTHVYHVYAVATARRPELMAFLQERGVHTLVHYPIAPHLQEAYSALALSADSLPQATQAAKRVLSLPMWPQMQDAQVDAVTDAVQSFFKR